MHLPWAYLALGAIFLVLALSMAGNATRTLMHAALRMAIGFAVVMLADRMLGAFGFNVAANPLTGAVVGFLGIPGFLLLAVSGRILG